MARREIALTLGFLGEWGRDPFEDPRKPGSIQSCP